MKPLLMGILNVTPDSFSDGGLYGSVQVAVDAGLRMIREGADLIDVGGESTRPGAAPVAADEELRRVVPVIEGLVAGGARVSVDTSKAMVAAEALRAGATFVNDVTALGDPDMAGVCARAGCEVCLMHMKGEPRTMQKEPVYENVFEEVRAFLLARARYAESCGIAKRNIWIDPGIGFGKTPEHSLTLLKELSLLVHTGYPVLVGVSRKSFIGRVLGGPDGPLPVTERLEGTLAAQVVAQMNGSSMIRAHDVLAARRTIDMTSAICS